MLFDENREIDKSRNMLHETIATSCAAPGQRLEEVVYLAASLLDCSVAMITDGGPNRHVLACAVKDAAEKSIAAAGAAQRWLDPIDAERIGLVFYCDFPLRAATGDTIGYLAIYDVAHRAMGQIELDRMMRLSRIAAALLGRDSGS